MSALRVAIDVTPFLGARTGVAAFVRGLVDGLAARDDVSICAFGLTWRGRQAIPDLVPPGIDVVTRPMPANPLRQAWLRLPWPPIEWWTGASDVVHGTNFVVPPSRRAAQVVTVHDLTSVHFPEMVERASLAHEPLIRRALRRGAFVHTPSAFVREEVVERFGLERERVVAIHHGIPPLTGGVDAARVRALVGEAPYVLSLGTIEPRKDVPTLVRAFDVAAESDGDARLVLAGPEGWGSEDAAAAIAGARHRDRIVRLGYVSDADRSALLHGARVFAFPSLYEGFGFPPLEAMAAGVPVVATRAGALPEVLGDAAAFVTERDVDGLARAIGDVLEDDSRRRDLAERGARQVARFTWDRATAEMIDLYQRVERVSP